MLKKSRGQVSKPLLLFGGTFNPVHNGHVALSLHVKKQLGADLVVIPCGIPTHRDIPSVSAQDRFRMIELAYAGVAGGVSVSDYEIQKDEGSYFYYTLEHFRESSDRISVLIGSDQANRFRMWHKWQELLTMADFIVIERFEPLAETLPFTVVKTPLMEISSTEIREMLDSGDEVKGLIPESVEDYIKAKGLYGV